MVITESALSIFVNFIEAAGGLNNLNVFVLIFSTVRFGKRRRVGLRKHLGNVVSICEWSGCTPRGLDRIDIYLSCVILGVMLGLIKFYRFLSSLVSI